MTEKKSFFRNIVEYSISTWVNFFVGIISVVATTRLLAPDVYGLVAIFYSSANVALYALTLGLDGAYIRFYNEPPSGNSKQQLLFKSIFVSIISCIIFGLILFFWGGVFSECIFGIGSKILSGLFWSYVVCQILLRFLNITFRMSFRVWQYNIQNILINCLAKVLIIVAAVFTNDFLYIIFILTVGLFSTLVVYLFVQKKEFVPIANNGKIDLTLNFKGYYEYFRYSLFSAPTYIVHFLNIYLNQEIVLSMISAHALGLFSSTSLFGSILTTIRGGFSTFWSAYVFQSYDNDKDKIAKMHDFVMAFTIVAASVLVLLRDLIYIFIGQSFHASKVFFSLLLVMPIFSFLSITTTQGIAIAKKNHIELIADVVCVVCNVGLCVILIPWFGLTGAASANAISALLLFAINSYYGQKYYTSILTLGKSLSGMGLIIAILIVPSIFYNIKTITFVVLLINTVGFLLYKKEMLAFGKIIYLKLNGIFTKNIKS